MTVMQVYEYFSKYGSDRIYLKVLVGGIVILESLHLALACHYVYFYLIQHFGEIEYIKRIVWSLFLSGRIGFVVAWLVNMFYVRRIYILSQRNLLLCIFIASLSTVRPAFGFAGSAYATRYPEWAPFAQHARWMFITGLSFGLAGDFMIAATVSYYLLKARSTNVPSTRNLVTLLLWYTINTTAILTIFAAVEMIFLVIQPKTLTFFGLFQIQIQLYANCFLTTLNARQSLQREVPIVTNITMPKFRPHNPTHTTVTTTTITSTTVEGKDESFIDNQLEHGDTQFSTDKVSPV